MATEPPQKDNKTAIILGVLTLSGVLATAVFGNWDKLIPTKSEQPEVAPAPTAPSTVTQSANGSGNIQVSGANNTITVGATPAPKACRDPSHGIEKYSRTFDVDKNSSWLGGGFDQEKWCNQVIAELRGQHPSGDFSVIKSSEKSESKCAPLNCPQYMYYCSVRVKTDPVYVEKLSSACK